MKKKNVPKEAMKEVLDTISSKDAKNVRGGGGIKQESPSINIGIRITF